MTFEEQVGPKELESIKGIIEFYLDTKTPEEYIHKAFLDTHNIEGVHEYLTRTIKKLKFFRGT